MHDSPPSEQKHLLTGRLRKYHSNFYYVEADGVLYECMLRGLIKKEGMEPLVGDFVELDSVNEATRTARVHRILERETVITRPKLANVAQVFIVYSLKEPEFDPFQMDRYLTHVELAGLRPILTISKADLAESNADRERIQSIYAERLGYPVLFVSTREPDSVQAVHKLARNTISVLAGPSGSGKSSLLNALNPALKLRVGEVSEKIARGQHTTRHVELLSLFDDEPDTLIADTPGFSNLKFNYVLPVRIQDAFRDFAPWRGQCAFSDCLHVDEEGCAVREHLADIAASRYQSYLDMLAEARLFKEESSASSQKEEFGYKKLDRKGKDSLRILRLKEKNRDLSRKTLKQQLNNLPLDAENESLADDPPESV